MVSLKKTEAEGKQSTAAASGERLSNRLSWNSQKLASGGM